MSKVIISIFFIVVGIIFLISTFVYTRNKNSLKDIKTKNDKNIKKVKKTLSNIWGIDEIKNQILTTNKNQHSIIIELGSIEYNLLYENEQNSVDRELISIAKMIKFPIQFLEVKEQLSMKEAIENIEFNTANANDYIKEYAKNIISHLYKIQQNQNLFERKCYMIISSFNKREIAEVELKEFYNLLKYHLMNIKIGTRLLNDRDIIELLYKQFHKGNKNVISKMKEKGGFDLYVKAKKK